NGVGGAPVPVIPHPLDVVRDGRGDQLLSDFLALEEGQMGTASDRVGCQSDTVFLHKSFKTLSLGKWRRVSGRDRYRTGTWGLDDCSGITAPMTRHPTLFLLNLAISGFTA